MKKTFLEWVVAPKKAQEEKMKQAILKMYYSKRVQWLEPLPPMYNI